MLTKQRKVLSAMVLTVALTISLSPTAQARGGEPKPKKPTPTTPKTKGGKISIMLSGTALKGGSPGHSVSRKVSVPAPCWMEPSFTGKEYYEFVTGTGAYTGKGMADINRHMGEEMTAEAGYEKYKDDTTGHWWGGICTSGNYDGPIKEFIKFADEFFDEHPFTFIPAGQPEPVPPVPPEVLRDVAFAEMELPLPAIDWNPKRTETGGTVVNFDTWVWLRDRRDNLFIRATANTLAGEIFAQVDVGLQGMTVSAPGAETAECEGPGVPYSSSATGECAIRFTRAAAATPVTTQTTWLGTWFGTGRAAAPLPTQPTAPPSVTQIRVDEVHAVVTR